MTKTVTLKAEGDSVFVHIPEGFRGSILDLVAYLRQELPGVAVDWTAVREALTYGKGCLFPIASRRPEALRDEKAKIRFSPDALSAYLILYPPKPRGLRLEESELLALTAAYGIPTHLLDRQGFRLACLRRSYHEPERIASGHPAADGAPARIAWSRGIPSDPLGFLAALGKAEEYPGLILANCREGQVLGVRHPPGPGTPGLAATGKPISARPGTDPVHLGEGLASSPDGLAVVALKDGHLQLAGPEGNQARVLPLLTVKDPQDLKPWSQRVYPGSVVVEGDLEVPFPVRILGDMEVRGGVVRSPLEVMGSLFVRDGVIQHGGGALRVGGILSAGFLERAWVMAHTIHIRRYSLKSRLGALETILTDDQGSIQGGQASSGGRLLAGSLGTENAMQTVLTVGAPGCTGPFEALYRGWAEALEAPTDPEMGPEVDLSEAADQWRARLLEVEEPDPRTAAVEAGKVYPGVTVKMGSASRDVESPVGPVSFLYERIGPRGRVALNRH